MIVIFPLLVSRNVNTNLVQGLAVVLERYIASYAISDFVGKEKEFNKYYNYKMKGGKIYQESDSTLFDVDPLTRSILENQEALNEEILDQYGNPMKPSGKKGGKGGSKKNPFSQDVNRAQGKKAAQDYLNKKDVKIAQAAKDRKKTLHTVGQTAISIDQALKDLKSSKEPGKNEKLSKPGFSSASISQASLNLEPTWVEVQRGGRDGGTSKLGIKVIPMMIEGFNIKHTISSDMQKYFVHSFIAGIGRKVMRLVYKLIDRWTFYGNRPRGDIRHDVFYARTGHDGQPFVLVDKNEDIPKLFFAQPQNMLKLWKLSWGNLLVADDIQKTVMFCMKKYKGMCSNFSYGMIFAQSKDMGKVFEDMEDARKATGSLFRFNKKISSLGGKR